MKTIALDNAGEEYPNVYTGEPILIDQFQTYIETQAQVSAGLTGNKKAVPVRYATTSFSKTGL